MGHTDDRLMPISCCGICKHFAQYSGIDYCEHDYVEFDQSTRKVIENSSEFPIWCKLERVMECNHDMIQELELKIIELEAQVNNLER